MELRPSNHERLDWRQHRSWAAEAFGKLVHQRSKNLHQRLAAEIPLNVQNLSAPALCMSSAFAYILLEKIETTRPPLSTEQIDLLKWQAFKVLIELERRSNESFSAKETQHLLRLLRGRTSFENAPWWQVWIESDAQHRPMAIELAGLELASHLSALLPSIEHIRQNEPFLAWKDLHDLTSEASPDLKGDHHFYQKLAFGLFTDINMIKSEIRCAVTMSENAAKTYACLFTILFARNEFDWILEDKTLSRPLDKLLSSKKDALTGFLKSILSFVKNENLLRLGKVHLVLEMLKSAFELRQPEQQLLALAAVHRLVRREHWAYPTKALGEIIKYASLRLSDGTCIDLWNLTGLQENLPNSAQPIETLPISKVLRALGAASITFRISSLLGPRKLSKLLSQQKAVALTEGEIEGVMSILVPYLSRMKGPMLKAGQTLSYMYLGLPTQLIRHARPLQMEAEPLSFKTIYEQIEKHPQLCRQIIHIESTPLGVGSIGQVHRAELKDGRQVAIKVKFPEIETVIQNDLDLLKLMVGILELLAPRLRLRPYIKELRENILKECDYLCEARSQLAHRNHIHHIQNFYIPEVYLDLCTENILVTELVSGLPYSEACEQGSQDQKNLWGKALVEYTVTCCRDGSFNTDPHPGNLLFQKDRIIYLDFGSVCSWQERERDAWNNLIMTCLNGTTESIRKAMGPYKNTGLNLKNSEKLAAALHYPLPGCWTFPGVQALNGNTLAQQMKQLVDISISKTNPLNLPKEFIFGIRVYFGHMAVVAGLGSEHDWSSLVTKIMRPWHQQNL